MRTRVLFINFLFYFLVSSYQVVEKINNDTETRIIGGIEATPHEAPWMISIQRWDYSTYTFDHICGGTILQPHIILTAAHCLEGFRSQLGYLFAGRHNLSVCEKLTQQYRSFNHSDITIHDGYTSGISSIIHDIDLIKLLNPFVIDAYVNTITLPNSTSIPHGSVRLYGWGSTNYTENVGGVLITAPTAIIDIEECDKSFNIDVLDTNICTASEGTAACGGDSGGPVTQRCKDDVDVVVGIVSWGFLLCGRPPSVHTRVSAYVDWILVDICDITNFCLEHYLNTKLCSTYHRMNCGASNTAYVYIIHTLTICGRSLCVIYTEAVILGIPQFIDNLIL